MAASLSTSKFFNTMSSAKTVWDDATGGELFRSATSLSQAFGLENGSSAAEVQDLDHEDGLMRSSLSSRSLPLCSGLASEMEHGNHAFHFRTLAPMLGQPYTRLSDVRQERLPKSRLSVLRFP